MSKAVLGISAFYHDSAAALVKDGEIIAAAQEERFSRKKHDPRFPKHAINYCLEQAFIEPEELEAVVFYDNPVLTTDRIVKSILTCLPFANRQGLEEQWIQACQSTLGIKWHVVEHIKNALRAEVPIYFTRHHLAHAASAFYPSPFEDAAILTVDGVGEWATTSIAEGKGTQIKVHKEIHYPHSLGLLYSAFTYFCGFKVNSGEYKLMGLAPYGRPRFAEIIRKHLICVKPDGSYRLNTKYFGFLDSNVMTNALFDELFEGPARKAESRITRREMDLAASVQEVLEEVVLMLARETRDVTGLSNLVMAGGVALNCVANGRLLRENVFDRIWIQPASGDAGGALGAALLGAYRLCGNSRNLDSSKADGMHGSYLGPAYSSLEVKAFLDSNLYPYKQVSDATERSRIVAKAIAQGKVVGFLSGRMEFGPRSLGARSILGDPRNPQTQIIMNRKIKFRESFRPFAPTVLREYSKDYFDLDHSPYMLLVAAVKENRCKQMDWTKFDSGNDDLLGLVSQERSDIPAVTHVDYSARIQTLDRHVHPDYYMLIDEFHKLTGCAVLVNTSFNVRGEPIVCSPKDAYLCFMRTDMDMLVLEDCLLEKDSQPGLKHDSNWQEEYELD